MSRAYHVTVRRISTGADYSGIVFVASELEAYESLMRRVRLGTGLNHGEMRWIETRKATRDEIDAHMARLRGV